MHRGVLTTLAIIATFLMSIVGPGEGVSRGAVVVAFGDSTTKVRLPDIPKVYAQLLQDQLPGLLGESVSVYNAGVSGNRTDQALTRLNTDVRARHPDIVIVQFGINDSWVDSGVQGEASRVAIDAATQIGHPKASRGNYTDNLTSIVDTLRNDNARVILMTPNQIQIAGSDPYPIWRNDLLGQYAQAVRNVATAESVELLDVWQMYSAYADAHGNFNDLLLVDGMHPGQAGHQMVADRLMAMIVPEPRCLHLLVPGMLCSAVYAYRWRN